MTGSEEKPLQCPWATSLQQLHQSRLPGLHTLRVAGWKISAPWAEGEGPPEFPPTGWPTVDIISWERKRPGETIARKWLWTCMFGGTGLSGFGGL